MPSRFAKIRFRLLLPIVMVVLSAMLMVISSEQQRLHPDLGMGTNMPARTIIELMNGPGFFFSSRNHHGLSK